MSRHMGRSQFRSFFSNFVWDILFDDMTTIPDYYTIVGREEICLTAWLAACKPDTGAEGPSSTKGEERERERENGNEPVQPGSVIIKDEGCM